MDVKQFEARKRDHIQYALDSAHQASGGSGLDQIRLIHDALPELDFSEITLKTPCLKWNLETPFFVAGMTAGHPDAFEINSRLAKLCEKRGWAMGVGSQRRELETGQILDPWKELRASHPKLVLFANVGLSQLIETSADRVAKLIEGIGAQALVVHVNALQETLQPEGTPRFRGGLKALQSLCGQAPFPIVLKETGCGFSTSTCVKLVDLGLAAIDVSGLGGTHWGRIEGARAEERSVHRRASQTFANWGEPTVESVLAASKTLSEKMEVWASGGVRTGLDAAKLIALGAQRIGYAKPALEAALQGEQALDFWMSTQEFELKTALFCTGSVGCDQLRTKKEYKWKRTES
ncbi:MAG: type 2 isopentenyl-diphosphate Delta-isomerase [Bdellovibrio sp.]|nr:type 2 isopentenyl-diphosphate Delta-isomerase [Bdellovibrio sp.]